MMASQTDYAALIAYGFSPAKAGEILLDVKRGDWFAARVLEHARAGIEPEKAADK